MQKNFSKWVSFWGNAMSISENRPESYSKNITLRYPLFCPFDGDKIRLNFDNYCGTEKISIEKTTVLSNGKFVGVTFGGQQKAEIFAGKELVSDEIDVSVKSGSTIIVSFYLKEFTQMRSSVYVQGPLSGGKYAIGDQTETLDFDMNSSRKTGICYFLSNASVRTEEQNRALVCYGDSITAQDWPDHLAQKLFSEGIRNLSVVRKATSGSRILREYSCITYESYGLKGTNRFNHELPVDGAETVLIQQGINDIIHPVGTDINPFRPMSDLPSVGELFSGIEWYICQAKKMGLKVLLGTLLPIEGWRTYAPFREDLKNEFNLHLKNAENSDGCVDFDEAVRDSENPKAFAQGFDSGDHLHPSSKGYQKMADCAFKALKKGGFI